MAISFSGEMGIFMNLFLIPFQFIFCRPTVVSLQKSWKLCHKSRTHTSEMSGLRNLSSKFRSNSQFGVPGSVFRLVSSLKFEKNKSLLVAVTWLLRSSEEVMSRFGLGFHDKIRCWTLSCVVRSVTFGFMKPFSFAWKRIEKW